MQEIADLALILGKILMLTARISSPDSATPRTASLAPASRPRHRKHSPPARQRAEPVPNGTRRHSTPQAAVASADARPGQNYAWQPKNALSENGNDLTNPPTQWHAIYLLT